MRRKPRHAAPTGVRRDVDASKSRATVAPDETIVREPECKEITGLSRATRWRLERDGLFPKRRQLSPGCSGWFRSELAAWIAARK
jgi:predicted DNA-binding transcriptional regulator AlpA